MKNNKWKYPRLSYSRLSEFITDGPISLIHRKIRDTISLTKGSVLDDLLFLSKEDFKSKYIISRFPLPTASLLILANKIILEATTNNIKWQGIDILKTIKEEKLWKSVVKEEVLIKKFDTAHFYQYITNSIKAMETNRKVISNDIYEESRELANILLKDKAINFNFSNIGKLKNIFQQKLYFDYEGIKFLGYIDILQINHEDKTVKIIDLKTTSSKHTEFISSFHKYNYYIQGGLYTLGLHRMLKELGLKDYKILPFEFLVVSFRTKQAMTYIFTDKWFNASIFGYKDTFRYNKGINQCIDEIKWHFDNQIFNNSKYVITHNKRIDISSNNIIINETNYEGE